MKPGKNTIEIVIPIYKEELTYYENISITSCFRVLNGYSIVLCKPYGLNTSKIEADFNFTRIECFDPSYFDSVASYNRLMLSASFYERFLHSKYILVFQTDVFIFYDDLEKWITSDYDYVGAPWISKNKFGKCIPFVKMCIDKYLLQKKDIIHKYERQNKVGNGGFSLRKTKTHRDICIALKDDIERFLAHQEQYFFNEDIYLSIVPQRKGFDFKTPTSKEALTFAWDVKAKMLYKKTGEKLPMAAHGWFTVKNLPFWLPIIKKHIDKIQQKLS